MKSKEQLKGEIRYTIRLCARTARLYRHVQTAGTFLAIIGGSAALAGLTNILPKPIVLLGVILTTIAGAALIAIRPSDKAALNEADVRRYQTLLAKAEGIDAIELQTALEETRQGDTPEFEALRNVAYNDVVREINREDQLIELSQSERLWKALA